MRKKFIDQLAEGGWITPEQHQSVFSWLHTRAFSLHWELRALLYAGILCLTTGLGIAIYNNIDTIGHTVIILCIAAACAGCFFYCFKHRIPFSTYRVTHDSPFFDYVLLGGCLLFLALEGYLQYRYELFGTRYGLATLIPAVIFFGVAYYFDNISVLSLAITALAACVGISLSPGVLNGDSLVENSLIFTGAALSVAIIAVAFMCKQRDFKRHFTFTYYNFGFNLFFLCMLGGMFTFDFPFLYFGLLVVGCVLLGRYAILEKSFYLLLMAVIYGYIGFTWAMFQLKIADLFGLYYFVFSCIGVIYFFLNYKKILKLNK